MLQYLVLAYLLGFSRYCYGNVIHNEVDTDQQLVYTVLVNRHGERTPDSDELSLSANQKEELIKLSLIDGSEALTNVGKRRAYQIGKYIRQRYGSQGHKLLANLYIYNEIKIRCTDKDRTKMTAQVAMAATFPPEVEQQWDEGVGKVWQPVPYTVVPLSEDYLRYYSNCKRFTDLMTEAKKASLEEELLPYKDLIPKLKQETGQNFTQNPVLFETLFDLFKSQLSLGVDIPQWAKPILPRLSEAAKLGYRIHFRNDEMKKIGGGVLLSNFLKAASDIASGKLVDGRLRMFSAHDFNIGAFMDVSRVVNSSQILPEYGAVFSLELYKSRRTGQLSVMPVYLPQAGESTPQELLIEGCDDKYCNLLKFIEVTRKYVMPEQEFYRLCSISTEQ